jgi:hypothetical protein
LNKPIDGLPIEVFFTLPQRPKKAHPGQLYGLIIFFADYFSFDDFQSAVSADGTQRKGGESKEKKPKTSQCAQERV